MSKVLLSPVNNVKKSISRLVIEVPVGTPEWNELNELLSRAEFKGSSVQYMFSFVDHVAARCEHAKEEDL